MWYLGENNTCEDSIKYKNYLTNAENSLIKILVLGINDREIPFLWVLKG